jgi:hypothetical protein
MRTAGGIGAYVMGRRHLLLEGFDRPELGRYEVAGILQQERLGAVADHDPFAVADQ